MKHPVPFSLLCMLLCTTPGFADEPQSSAFHPPVFAFQNGVAFGSIENEVATLRQLGYDGIGSASVRNLDKRIDAYDKAGLKVFSIYVDVSNKNLLPAITLLKDKNATMELTVRQKIDDATVKTIQDLADHAAKANVRIALYPHTGFAVATIDSALDLIAKVDRPNVGLMFNLCHFLKNEKHQDLEATLQKAGAKIFAVSTCGADEDGTGWNTLIQPLDRGSFDQTRLFATLKKIGFRGAVGIQCYGVPGDKKLNLARTMKAWKKVLADVNK